eukprot:Sspe_Gene.36925::Locus_17839_Transcript_1_1_Confidence_1.000_Length_2014::g.36925::m.36925/K01613/psd, PISD; phosphatidylserine decarboxylase
MTALCAVGVGFAGGVVGGLAGLVLAAGSNATTRMCTGATAEAGGGFLGEMRRDASLATCLGATFGTAAVACAPGVAAAAFTGTAAGLVATTAGEARVWVVGRDGKLCQEKVLSPVNIGMRLMYGSEAFATASGALRVKRALRHVTLSAADYYNAPRTEAELRNFVAMHSIDLSEAYPPDLSSYTSYNAVFTRRLRAGVRPLPAGGTTHFLSPADSRTVVFPTTSEACSLWIKGRRFTVPALLSDTSCAHRIGVSAAVVVSRLSPQDYHRFHSPVSGTVVTVYTVPGEYYTVNPIAVRNPAVDVFIENKRAVVGIASPCFGFVAVVPVGATLVGSVVLSVQEGDEVRAGDELGYFAFGGSTVVTVLPSDAVVFDERVLRASQRPIETLVLVKESLGCCSRPPPTGPYPYTLYSASDSLPTYPRLLYQPPSDGE